MKIVIATSSQVAAIGAGDFQQAVQTAKALGKLGHCVAHRLADDRLPATLCGLKPISQVDLESAEVVHYIPRSPLVGPLREVGASGFKGVIACSTVYWDSWEHRKVVAGCGVKRYVGLARYAAKVLRSRLGLKQPAYPDATLLLPNSEGEVAVLRRFYALPKGTRICPIPNGVPDDLFDGVAGWEQSANVVRDIILFPGIFAGRKNQLGFIRALRDHTTQPVVFMGGALDSESGRAYLERCKAEAPSNWVFTGRIDYLSEEFRYWMLRAKIACLASSCETPGLALLEGAVFGARPVITREGGTHEYYGDIAEYVNSTNSRSMRAAVARAWARGALSSTERAHFEQFRWSNVARATVEAYRSVAR